jgi:hypothetical protein
VSVPSDDSVGVLFGPQGHPAGPSIVSIGKHEISTYSGQHKGTTKSDSGSSLIK